MLKATMISNHIINISNKATFRSICTQIKDHYPARTYQDRILVKIYDEILNKKINSHSVPKR